MTVIQVAKYAIFRLRKCGRASARRTSTLHRPCRPGPANQVTTSPGRSPAAVTCPDCAAVCPLVITRPPLTVTTVPGHPPAAVTERVIIRRFPGTGVLPSKTPHSAPWFTPPGHYPQICVDAEQVAGLA